MALLGKERKSEGLTALGAGLGENLIPAFFCCSLTNTRVKKLTIVQQYWKNTNGRLFRECITKT